ncbi:hypothetical protein [Streptomyces sp. NPDC052012]|uniref:hypothetical protein n=1 Tax=Streptomyces sp. NPDC052012 TaxID=3155051 RepID=UPI0034503382
MPRHPRYADQGNDASEPVDPPNVYLPQPPPPPAYDAYADPAAAHGWQNAYDETAELPPVAEGGAASGAEPAPHRPGGGEHRSHRAPGRRARRSGARPSRRVAMTGGALGAVTVAALVAGFAFSGSSSDGTGEKGKRTGPAAEPDTGESAPPAATDGPTAGAGPGTPAPGDDATSGAASSAPSAGASTTSAPTLPTATAPSAGDPGQAGPGNSGDRPGRGHGATKRPK